MPGCVVSRRACVRVGVLCLAVVRVGVAQVVVMKAHSFDDVHRRARLRMFRNLDPSDTLVFMTARNHTESALAQELREEYNLPVAYTAVTSDVAVEGYRVGHNEYQRLLGLSDRESAEVLEWLELWSDIRVCCGAQMSDAWRHVLAPDASVPCTSFAGGGGGGASSSSSKTQSSRAVNSAEKCQLLNISRVEHAIMQTELYKSMRERVPMLARASSRDGPLTGDYCEICSQNVRGVAAGLPQRLSLHWSRPIDCFLVVTSVPPRCLSVASSFRSRSTVSATTTAASASRILRR